MQSITLSLPSDPGKGYVVDADKRYDRDFAELGWDAWYKKHPKANGFVTVSRPAIDERTGHILVYIGKQWHYTSGQGRIILYRYEAGQMIEVRYIELWVS